MGDEDDDVGETSLSVWGGTYTLVSFTMICSTPDSTLESLASAEEGEDAGEIEVRGEEGESMMMVGGILADWGIKVTWS